MALVVNLSVGRLLAHNEKLTTAKINAVVKSIVIDISGSVGNADILAGAITPDKLTMGAYAFGEATFDGSATYTGAWSPAITTYTDGLWLAVKCDTINPGAVSLDAGGGAKPILKHGGRGQLDAGDIVTGGIITVRFNTTLVGGGCWELMSLPGRPVETRPMVGASGFLAGLGGLTPDPKAGQQTYYLRADGTWVDVVAQLTTAFALADTYQEVFKQQTFI